MGDLPNDLKLSRISIPGTHDSMTKHAISGVCTNVVTKHECLTQDMTLQQQLRIGIRFFDIRLRQDQSDPKKFHIFHGPADLNITLVEVMNIFNDYLKLHENETVMLSYQANSCKIPIVCNDIGVRDWEQFKDIMLDYTHHPGLPN